MINPYGFPKFIGRDENLGKLEKRLNRAKMGESSAIILFGDAGIGKTRILQEFEKKIMDESFVVYERTGGFFGIESFYEHLLRLIHKSGKDYLERLGTKIKTSFSLELKIKDIVETLRGDDKRNILTRIGGRLLSPEAIAGVSSFLSGIPFGLVLPLLYGTKVEVGSREKEGQALKAVFFEMLDDMNRRIEHKETALVLIIDQWDDILRLPEEQVEKAKGFLMELLDYNRIHRYKVMCILGVREGRIGQAIGGDLSEKFDELQLLGPLSEEESRRLVREPVQGQIDYDDDVVEDIIRITRRNPFYILYICQRLFEFAVEEATGKVDMSLYRRTIPETLEGCYGIRLRETLDASPDKERTIDLLNYLAFAAVDYFTEEEILRETGTAADKILETLVKRQFLKYDERERAYCLFHPIIREHLQTHFGGQRKESLAKIRLLEKMIENYMRDRRESDAITFLTDLYRETKMVYGQASEYCLEKLASLLSRGEDIMVRSAAAVALGNTGDSRAVSELLSALKDDDPRLRKSVIKTLRDLGDRSVVPALLDCLYSDRNDYVRYEAAVALQDIGDHRAVPALLEALEDRNGGVRKSAAIALGAIKDGRAVPELLTALRSGSNLRKVKVRQAIVWALGEIGDDRAVLVLLDFLRGSTKDHDVGVRKRAAMALGKIRDERAITGLTEALQDKQYVVRKAVEDAIVSIKSRDYLESLLQGSV